MSSLGSPNLLYKGGSVNCRGSMEKLHIINLGYRKKCWGKSGIYENNVTIRTATKCGL